MVLVLYSFQVFPAMAWGLQSPTYLIKSDWHAPPYYAKLRLHASMLKSCKGSSMSCMGKWSILTAVEHHGTQLVLPRHVQARSEEPEADAVLQPHGLIMAPRQHLTQWTVQPCKGPCAGPPAALGKHPRWHACCLGHTRFAFACHDGMINPTIGSCQDCPP